VFYHSDGDVSWLNRIDELSEHPIVEQILNGVERWASMSSFVRGKPCRLSILTPDRIAGVSSWSRPKTNLLKFIYIER
jgi:hypothetical protein